MIFEQLNLLDEEVRILLNNKLNKSNPYEIPSTLKKKAKRVIAELEENHDYAWAIETYLRQKFYPNRVALIYRGREISTAELYANAYIFAKSLKALGIKKGDTVPIMVSNSPEFVYLMIALNMVGAVMNTVGQWFAPGYLTEIFESCNCEFFFASDDAFGYAIKAVEKAQNINQIVLFSLTDSLLRDSEGKVSNPYKEYDDQFSHFKNLVAGYKEECKKVVQDGKWFFAQAETYVGSVLEDMVLDDACAITYTSGTTKPGYPKGCIHSNRNYMTLARFKKTDVSGLPNLKTQISLAHLPSYTQTVLSTAYTDGLYMGWTIALEPYFELEFYPYSLLINKPQYTVACPEYEKYIAKLLDTDWKAIDMPFRVCVCIAGQAMSPGLEHYLNRISKEHKFGKAVLPYPFAPVTMTIAGGTTENGGFFITMFKGLYEKHPKYKIFQEHMYLKPISLAETEVLADDGHICSTYERGICVVNTPANQIGYVNPEYNANTMVVDVNGKRWRTTATPAYKNKFGEIRMVDRPGTDFIMEDGSHVPVYIVCDPIQVDVANIMDAVVVGIPTETGNKYVCHIEKQPNSTKTNGEVIESTKQRLKGKCHIDIYNNLYFRFRSFEEGFPVNGTGKTDLSVLMKEGIPG